jgi:hypothetical protein
MSRDLRLEFVEGFWRDAPLAPVIRDAEPQGFALSAGLIPTGRSTTPDSA